MTTDTKTAAGLPILTGALDKMLTPAKGIEAIKTKAVADAKKRQAKKPAKAKAKKPAKRGERNKRAAFIRANSKQARFIAAMQRPQGISIDEAAKMFDWQKHTVRGAVAGALKRKLKLKVDATQDDKRGTVYRLKK